MDINTLIDLVEAHDDLSASLYEEQFRHVDPEQVSLSTNDKLVDVE